MSKKTCRKRILKSPARQSRKRNADIATVLLHLDAEAFSVTEGGRRKRMTSFEVEIRKTFQAAIGGDLKAAKLVFRMMQEYGLHDWSGGQKTELLVVPDQRRTEVLQ